MAESEIVHLALVAAVVGVLLFFAFRSKKTPPRQIVDDLPDEPYRAYTTEFDAVLHGSEIHEKLSNLSPDRDHGHYEISDFDWMGQVASAENYAREGARRSRDRSSDTPLLSNTAVLLLVDQSGSMRGRPMAWLAADLRQLSKELVRSAATVQIAGFTTAGWHGGFARLKWLEDGRPARPGRLCALLHIVYKAFDEADWNKDSWRAVLDPNLLRENIDGEALLWAASELRERPEAKKMLIVVSDGAPVDDSTLMENGPSILDWHLRKVSTEIEEAGDIDLRGVGIGYNVEAYYQHSISIDVGKDFVSHAWDLLISEKTDATLKSPPPT